MKVAQPQPGEVSVAPSKYGEAATYPGGKKRRLSWKLWHARPICLRLFWHCVRAAASRTFCTAGTSSAMRMPVIAMTTKNSIRVNAGRGVLGVASIGVSKLKLLRFSLSNIIWQLIVGKRKSKKNPGNADLLS